MVNLMTGARERARAEKEAARKKRAYRSLQRLTGDITYWLMMNPSVDYEAREKVITAKRMLQDVFEEV